MNLAAERDYLAKLIAPIGTVKPYLPERLNPPLWIITPADPYVTNGDTFGTVRVHFVLTFVGPVKTAASTAPALDQALDDAVAKLLPGGYRIEEVSAPFVLQANNAQYPAVSLTASNPTDL
ncbi:hypothetical protein HUN59_04645 [Curtobacterium sp. Csp2]|uniref:hypothetical protein n=1 Tax=Curtobacterium sp. Csp2 TaxID=2495430 RepID=UPI001580E068|nr:hypothetical protein [Curtobacterium sp. Csp2]QKS15600.1 hypothetical protein HUN59_04645 [Curtobacterium sp. Csp2]